MTLAASYAVMDAMSTPTKDATNASIDVRSAGIQPGDGLEFDRATIDTDKAAARVFAQHCGSFARHNPAWGWLVWDGARWKRDEEGTVFYESFMYQAKSWDQGRRVVPKWNGIWASCLRVWVSLLRT